MNLRLLTIVGGEPYLTWMRNGLVPSLLWEKNRSAIRHAQWHIYTPLALNDRVIDICHRVGLDIVMHEIEPITNGGITLAAVMREFIMDCAAEGDPFLVCPPDTIFGEQSLETIVAMSREPHSVVSVAPVRVNPTFMDGFDGEPMSNARMVSRAWQHLHPTWRDANIRNPKINSFIGGVSWKQTADNLYSVTHLLPTPFLIHPHPSDSEWFRLYGGPGTFDHHWPAKIVDEGRQRFIGSSDGAFAVEITNENENLPPMYPTDPNNPSQYSCTNKHNHVNRNTVVIFRRE
jgi:hypothetical protein